ncbi:MAG TPA: DinB family protein [Gemmatimonadaceae bacterium]|nr:DinB family protein [Gemmatimonadaceae bacterium]
MHPRIAELVAYLDAETEKLNRLYDSVPAERRAVRPAADRWSPAENVHHIAITERRLAARITALADQARALDPEDESSPVFATSPATRAIDRSMRIKTGEAGQPRNTDPSRVWDELMDARRQLTAAIAAADGLALGAVSAPHPALGQFTGYDWIAFAGTHVARHAAQIREGL